jgi:hypothetical protein
MYEKLFEDILAETEVNTFLKKLPSPLIINNNIEGENNIPFRFIGMLDQANSILRQIKFKEAVNLLGPFNSSLQKVVETTTINLVEILPTILEYKNKIQMYLNGIENHVIHFGIPHYDLFSSAILNSYSKSKKEVIIGLNNLKIAGSNDNLCKQIKSVMTETINSILRQIRRYYFWSLCSKRTRDEIRDRKILTYIIKTYRSIISKFELNDILLN